MAPYSNTLAWKIPWAEEPGRLQSMGSLRVGHDWVTSLSLFTFTFHFHALEKEMATTPVFLPGESQRWGSLVSCCLWGRTESDMTEVTEQLTIIQKKLQHLKNCVYINYFKCIVSTYWNIRWRYVRTECRIWTMQNSITERDKGRAGTRRVNS